MSNFSLAVHLNILVFITFTVLIVNTVVFLHFFHEENHIDFAILKNVPGSDELHYRMFSTVAHKGKTQLNIELDTKQFYTVHNNIS